MPLRSNNAACHKSVIDGAAPAIHRDANQLRANHTADTGLIGRARLQIARSDSTASQRRGRARRVDVAVGKAIRFYRLEAGLTQEILAEQLGLAFQQLQKYELGVNRCSAGRLYVIARILQRPVAAFYPSGKAAEVDEIMALADRATTVRLLNALKRIGNAHLCHILADLAEGMAPPSVDEPAQEPNDG